MINLNKYKEEVVNKTRAIMEDVKSNRFKSRYTRYAIAGLATYFVGVLSGGPNRDQLQKINSYDTVISEKANLEGEVESLNKEIDNLTAKLEEAKPYFDMKEEEQKQLAAQVQKEKEEREAREKAEAEAKKKAELEARSVTLSNGNFTAGTDFEGGVYDIIAISGGGNVSSSNMYRGGLNAIMGVANDGFYELEYKNIKLPDGTTLKVDGVTIKLVPKE